MTDPLPRETSDLASRLQRLDPAPPSHALMARLRAARPSRQTEGLRLATTTGPAAESTDEKGTPTRRRPIRTAWFSAAAAVVVLGAWGITSAPRPQPARPIAANPSSADPSAADPSATDPVTAASPAIAPPAVAQATVSAVGARQSAPLFLPVRSSQRLVSVQPVPVSPRPDEAPRRFYRAVFMEDVAAVDAQTDSVLVFSKPREVYLTAPNTVY